MLLRVCVRTPNEKETGRELLWHRSAGVSSYAYVADEKGRKLWAGPVATEKAAFERLVKRFRRGGLAIAIEAGNQTAWVYDELVKLEAQVTVVNPAKVKLIAESRRKTDKIDAKILCELLRLDGLPHPVHMPGPEARELAGCWWLAGNWCRPARSCATWCAACCGRRACVCRRELSTPAGWKRLFAAGFEHDHLMHIVSAYHDSFLALTKSIHELDQQLAEREKNEPRAARLKTMPKVGRIASLTFLAAVDDVHRFPTSRKLVGYTGLWLTVRQSGERTEYGAISRQGRSELRAVWVQIAHMVATDKKKATQPLRTWFNRVGASVARRRRWSRWPGGCW